MRMEGEASNFAMDWMVVMASLCYSHAVGNITASHSTTTTRLFLLLPVVSLFLFLPLNLTSIYLCGVTAFFVAWLAVFKLLLFAFRTGPLFSQPPLSLPSFILSACFPIKIHQIPSKLDHRTNPSLKIAIKFTIFVTHMPVFARKPLFHPKLFLAVYSVYLYLGLELILGAMAALARAFLGVDLEPQFNDPYLATSLQDFWGKRWNLMVSTILRPTVFDPVRSICSRWIGRRHAPLVAVIATFLVSGFMHELIFYYIGRIKPTWELTCFFVIHGMCVAAEMGVKKKAMKMKSKWRLPTAVSVVLTVSFVMVTGLWLFVPSLMKCEADIKAQRETMALFQFFKSLGSKILWFSKEESFAILSSSNS